MTTRKKIGLTTLVLFLIAIQVIIIFTLVNRQRQETLFREYAIEQVKDASREITELHETYNYWVAHDFSLWDELGGFVAQPDSAWGEENLEYILQWYEMNGAWTVNADGETVYSMTTGCANMAHDKQFPAEVLEKVREQHLFHYYMVSGNELMLLQGATIHPTGDEDRETEPMGYLFVGKCWDQQIMDLLEALTGSEITLHDHLKETTEPEDTPMATPYSGWQGETVATLLYTKRVDFVELLRENTRQVLWLLLGSMATTFLVLWLALKNWVNKPLQLVEKSIAGNTKRHIRELKKASSDFERIGDLIGTFIVQKEELIRQKERAEQSDRLKSAFLANVSHEIRTPMTGIIGFTELLKTSESLNREEQQQYLDIVLNSSEHLLRLIDDVIDLSMIESGNMTFRNSTVDIRGLLLELQAFYCNHPMVQEKALDIAIDYPDLSGSLVAFTDRVRLYQVMANLIHNAIKFSSDGKIVFGCKMYRDSALEFFVRDNGPGIDSKYHDHIFERFTRVKPDNLDTEPGGTGLGLSIARGIVEQMGGNIWVTSEPGRGSTFHFTVPAGA